MTCWLGVHSRDATGGTRAIGVPLALGTTTPASWRHAAAMEMSELQALSARVSPHHHLAAMDHILFCSPWLRSNPRETGQESLG